MNSNQNGGRRLDGYVRVSDVHGREGDSFISPDQQREKISAWATIHNHEIVFQEPELDVSGGKLKRPVLDRIMERIRSGETDGIAIARLDRFSRAGVGDALALIEEIKTVGGIFGCVEPQIDTSDPVMGEFILTIFLALARMERQRIRANWGDAKTRAVGRGLHVSANVPFGYIRPRGEENPRTGKKPTLPLEPDPATAWMVTELFKMRAAGDSWETLRRWLVSEDAQTVRGAEWATSTLMGVIKNRVYLGEARGAGGDHVTKDAHAALIDEGTWLAAQGRRGPRFNLTDTGALLRGLVRCGSCRYAMQARKGQNGRTGATDYLCNSRVGCPDPAIIIAQGPTGAGVDDVVVDMVREWEQRRQEAIEFDGFDPSLDVEGLEQELAGLVAARERDRLDEELQAALGRSEWLKHLADLTARVNEKQAELEETLRLRGLPAGQPSAEFWETWDSGEMSLEEKRTHLASVVQAVFIKPTTTRMGRLQDDDLRRRRLRERVRIVWTTDEPLLEIPRQGTAGYRIKPWPFPVRPNPDVFGMATLQPQVEGPGEVVG